jgi:hypothetical protein
MILCLPLLQLKVKGSKLAPIPDIGTLEALRLGAKLSVMKSSMRELMEGSEFLRVITIILDLRTIQPTETLRD